VSRFAAILRGLAELALLPFAVSIPAISIAVSDLAWTLFGRRRPPADTGPARRAASVVIPNWNGRDLLEKYLPSVIAAMAGRPENEIVVVDNGSQDGSADFLRRTFPAVRVLALDRNLGFGGGSNAGFRAARNDIVVLLNSDMRVAPDFLQPLLDRFDDPQVFAVACQIFFTDPKKPRQETGLTQGAWRDGMLRVRHRLDDEVTEPFPCFYPGGGSSAFDRRKFLELGGFDSLLAPFYLEDTDLGYMAWKRGWKVLYQPKSHVWHEHRGTIGKKFSQAYIDGVLAKNFALFAWKNIHSPRRLAAHFLFAGVGAALSALAGRSPERASVSGLARALAQLPGAIASRWGARSLAVIDDAEAFRRPLGGYYRDRFFAPRTIPERLSVLFLSPYAIEPPVHGGGVFMSQTLRELVKHADVHLVALLDRREQIADHAALASLCASFSYIVKMTGEEHALGSPRPHAVREFANADLEWLVHRTIFAGAVDAVQIEYTNMGQYACDFRRIATCIFEHDVYFQSVARGLRRPGGALRRAQAALEYLRALRFELGMLRRVDEIQVCTRDNAEYLTSFDRALSPKIRTGLRAGIDVASYEYRESRRAPDTILFVGSFRHAPNWEALEWFARHAMPRILAARPSAKLICVGSDPPPLHALPNLGGAIVVRGFVPDVRAVFHEYAVFVCPILSGSGVRVKLLEAFASGIPCVSTPIGAEGLARTDGELCRLAAEPEAFAQAVVELLDRPDAAMTARARAEVEQNWNMPTMTERLVERYRQLLRAKRV